MSSVKGNATQLITFGLLLIVAIVVVSLFFPSVDHQKHQDTPTLEKPEPQGFKYFTADPEQTGIIRPLWGPLYPLPIRTDAVRPSMRTLPWCTTPMNGGPQCRYLQGPVQHQVAYENNKI